MGIAPRRSRVQGLRAARRQRRRRLSPPPLPRRRYKEGLAGTGERRIYQFFFTRAELKALMEEAGFRDVRLYGLVMLPGWISRRLPLGLAVLESWWARLPALAPCGRLLVAVARR